MTPTTAATAVLPIMDRLKSETMGAHQLTESIPFSAAMMQGRLPKSAYVGQLASYREIHQALEASLRGSHNPAVTAVWRDDLAKTELLDRDLEFFQSELSTVSAEAREVAQEFAAWIHSTAKTSPIALLGVLYVLEGSTLGATILRQHIAAAYSLQGEQGLAYYSPYGNQAMPHWREFKQRMNDAVIDGADQALVLEAANTTFSRIGDILRALSHGL